MTARIVSTVAAVFLLIVFVYLVGVFSVFANWRPVQLIGDAQEIMTSLNETGAVVPLNSYVDRRKGVAAERYIVHHPDLVSPGYLLVNRLDLPSDKFVTELIDADGAIVNRWESDLYFDADDGTEGSFVHPAVALPDGSILVADDRGEAMTRMDACGDVVWSLTDQTYHHSIRIDPDKGGYWVWRAKVWLGGDDQNLMHFDPESGETFESISLGDDIILKSQKNRTLLRVPTDMKLRPDLPRQAAVDYFHPNDIKPLPANIAVAFPQFSAGDLLVSLRNIDTVAVIDRQTHDVLWAQYGPWRDQHDPDWQADGTITIYSNNQDSDSSQILRVDPKTNETVDVFAGTDFHFYSKIAGQHQLLPNGNWLVVSPLQGSVVEVTAQGEVVRELNNIFTENYNGVLSFAEWLPSDHFDGEPTCRK